jgi:pSer/pThr/pTyr-binding forkhead associated (FHA) protein
MIFLKLSLNGKDLNDYALDQDVVTIGTDPDNVVCLDSQGVLPHHARIDFDSLKLKDLSGQGVLVNGAMVSTTQLDNGDILGVGPFEMTFYHSKAGTDGTESQTETWKITRKEDAGAVDRTWQYVKTIKV